VYRARDTRLDRLVAIKVLAESLANDADRLQRFEQEARVGSTVNPNLPAIFDVGTQDGLHDLVSEFPEGQTWRERIGASAPRHLSRGGGQVAGIPRRRRPVALARGTASDFFISDPKSLLTAVTASSEGAFSAGMLRHSSGPNCERRFLPRACFLMT
jgi:serine/threonine protein kinase